MKITDIQTIFNNAINDSPWWQRFKGSEFVRYLVTFVSMVVERVNFASERRLQESFLSLAVSETSVLAHSESKGYVPRRRRPNKKALILVNKTANQITIPADTKWLCPDNGLYYLTKTPITLKPSARVVTECVQAEIVVYRYVLTKAEPYSKVLLDVATSDRVSDLKVFVTEPRSNRQEWVRSQLFRRTNASSLAYMEFYTPSEQVGIRFGNGNSGKIPAAQSEVVIECLLTDGATDVAAGMNLTIPTWPELSAQVDVTTGETIEPGWERESIEQIRHNALYYQSFDEQIVWSGDHRYFINRNVPGLNFISVWGEAEQEILVGFKSVEHINKIYISCHHPSMTENAISAQVVGLYSSVNGYNEHYVWVTPQHRPYTIRLTGKTLSTNDPDAIVEQLQALLLPLTNKSASAVSAQPNDIWKAIQSSGLLLQFDVDVVGTDLMTPPKPNEFRYLNLSQSIFQIER